MYNFLRKYFQDQNKIWIDVVFWCVPDLCETHFLCEVLILVFSNKKNSAIAFHI